MNTQKRSSRRTRVITQTIILIVIAAPFVLSFSAPSKYQFWYLNAGIFIIGVLLTLGGLMYNTPLADAIGIVTSRSRRFYLILGIIFIVVAIADIFINSRAL